MSAEWSPSIAERLNPRLMPRAARAVAGTRWYVVQTRPRAESWATANLERQGYRVFYPRAQKAVRHARAVRRELSPLFPGYVFVQRDISVETWRSVNGTFGVVRLIGCGDTPLPVPRGVVESLMSRAAADGKVDWTASLKPGQAVRVIDGPFGDFFGVLQSLDASGRVRVLLELMGRAVCVDLRYEALAPQA